MCPHTEVESSWYICVHTEVERLGLGTAVHFPCHDLTLYASTPGLWVKATDAPSTKDHGEACVFVAF